MRTRPLALASNGWSRLAAETVCVVSLRPQDTIATMPSNKSSKKTSNRRRRVDKMTGVNSSPTLFPDKYVGTMVYATSGSITLPASAVGSTVFRMNSVYDPDFSGVGTTVQAYTQAAALYGRYRVMHAQIELEFLNTSGNPITVFAVLTPTNNVGVDINAIIGQRHVWHRGLANVSGVSTCLHKMSAPIHTIYGVPKNQVRTEDDFAGLVGGVPNNQVFLHIGGHSLTAAAGAVSFKIRILYRTIWSLPKNLAL